MLSALYTCADRGPGTVKREIDEKESEAETIPTEQLLQGQQKTCFTHVLVIIHNHIPIIDLIQEYWIGGLVAVMVTLISLYCCTKGRGG